MGSGGAEAEQETEIGGDGSDPLEGTLSYWGDSALSKVVAEDMDGGATWKNNSQG